jgi:hypothetical protein
MKTFILVLLASSLIFASVDSVNLAKIDKMHDMMKKSGSRLQTAGSLCYWSIGVSALGIFLSSKVDPAVGLAVTIIGGAMFLIAPGFVISAGNNLNGESKIDFTGGRNLWDVNVPEPADTNASEKRWWENDSRHRR